MDLFRHRLCGPTDRGMSRATWWTSREKNSRKRKGHAKGQMRSKPVCPLRYKAAGPRFRLGGNKVPVCGFLQIANSLVRQRRVPMLFEKALAEIQLDTDRPAACSLLFEMLIQGELGRNNAGHRAARASSSSLGSSQVRSSVSSSSGQVRNRVALRKQADASADVRIHLGRRSPLMARRDLSARPSAKPVEANPRPSLDRSVIAAAAKPAKVKLFIEVRKR